MTKSFSITMPVKLELQLDAATAERLNTMNEGEKLVLDITKFHPTPEFEEFIEYAATRLASMCECQEVDFAKIAKAGGLDISTAFIDDLSDVDFGTSDLSDCNLTGAKVSKAGIANAKLPTNPEWHPTIID